MPIGRDLWVGLQWHGPDGAWVFALRANVTVGASHDVLYECVAPNLPGFKDTEGYVGNFYLVVDASVPTPTQVGTWGIIKQTYR